MLIELMDDEFCQVLAGLYCEWDRLTDELSAGPEDNPGFDQDGLLQAIRANQSLMARLVELRPEYEYLVSDALRRRETYER